MKVFRKERLPEGRRNFLICGIKIFSWFSRKSLKTFDSIIKKHKHNLYIVFAPYRSDYLNCIPDIDCYYKWIYDLTKNTDVKVLNFLSDKDFNYNDFEDTRHLKEVGAMKLTTKINRYLK